MATRKIVEVGDDILRKKSRPVDRFDSRLATLLDDMKETMYLANGVGLAAVQVGVLRRVVVLDCSDDRSECIELINPEIIETEGEQCETEGCLSLPGETGITRRPERVVVRAQDRNGDFFTCEGTGLKARCLCHETDHLDGVLFTDRLKRDLPSDF